MPITLDVEGPVMGLWENTNLYRMLHRATQKVYFLMIPGVESMEPQAVEERLLAEHEWFDEKMKRGSMRPPPTKEPHHMENLKGTLTEAKTLWDKRHASSSNKVYW